MCLRFSTALITGAALAVSSLAHAANPGTNPPSKKQPAPAPVGLSALAQVETILSYCETSDLHSASQYQEALKNILRDNSGGDDGSNSTSGAAKAALEAQLSKIPVSTGLSACRNFLAGK